MQDKALEGLLMVVQRRCHDNLHKLETRPHEVRFREDMISLLDTIDHVRREDKDPDEGFLDDEDWKHNYDSVAPKQPINKGAYMFISDGDSPRYASAVVVSCTPDRALVVTGSRCVQAKNYLVTDRGQRLLKLVHIDKDIAFLELQRPPKIDYLNHVADLAQVNEHTIICHFGKDDRGLMISYGRASRIDEGYIYTKAKVIKKMLGGPALVYENGVSKLLGINTGQGRIATLAPVLRRISR